MNLNIYIFEEKFNPTTQYYLSTVFKGTIYKVEYISIYSDKYPVLQDVNNVVFIVRYFNNKIINYINKHKKNIKQIFYLIDDNLLDKNFIYNLPCKYAFKVFYKAYIYKKYINEFNMQLIVSSDYLYNKYRKYKPLLLYPYPINLFLDKNNNIDNQDIMTIFYHHSMSYYREFQWIKNLFQKINNNDLKKIYKKEIVGCNKKIRDCVVFNYMNFNDYLTFCNNKSKGIGLAPVFNNSFNAGRSLTTLYNITRAKGVGIYSQEYFYSQIIDKNQAGIILPMDNCDQWVETIYELINNPTFFYKYYHNALFFIKNNLIDKIITQQKELKLKILIG